MYNFGDVIDRIESGSSKWNGHGAKQTKPREHFAIQRQTWILRVRHVFWMQ